MNTVLIEVWTQQEATRALANFCTNDSNHARIVEEGGLQLFIALAGSDNEQMRYEALRSLSFLSELEGNQIKIVEYGGLDVVSSLANSDDVTNIKFLATKILLNLCKNSNNHAKIISKIGLEPFFAVTRFGDPHFLCQSLDALALLSENENIQKKFVQTEYINKLINLTCSNDDKLVPSSAAKVLANLTANDKYQSEVLKAGGRKLVFRLIELARTGNLNVTARIKLEDLTVSRLIGEGSYAKVYEGVWRGQKVAIKKFYADGLNFNGKNLDLKLLCLV